jgi:Na+-driven multidrug efflux pump
MLQTALLIALPLPFPVVLYQFGVRLAALLVVIRMLRPPFLLAFQDNLVILRIMSNFLAVIIGSAPALALRLAANRLPRTIDGRQKEILAVRTTARLAQAQLLKDCEMNL